MSGRKLEPLRRRVSRKHARRWARRNNDVMVRRYNAPVRLGDYVVVGVHVNTAGFKRSAFELRRVV